MERGIKRMKIKEAMIISFMVMFLMASFSSAALAGSADVVSLGADLTSKQQEEVLKQFGVSEDEVNIITVTIAEVKDHLSGIATDKQIGTKAISSAYVKILPEGSGLQIDTHNVTLVTEEMYANAMVTAGVEDARVMVTAPFKVTGTTALTGIMMAFEEATGRKLTKEAKKVASEELLLTGEMGEQLGKDDAAKLMKVVKERVIKQKIKSPEDIRAVILEIAKQLDIELSEDQIHQILKLMEKISTLDLNVDKISQQLGRLKTNIGIIKDTIDKNKGVIQRIIDFILGWLRAIFGKANA